MLQVLDIAHFRKRDIFLSAQHERCVREVDKLLIANGLYFCKTHSC